jgi:hypothetical protein
MLLLRDELLNIAVEVVKDSYFWVLSGKLNEIT